MIQKTPITYYGGKQQLCSAIIGMMPPHRIYCEPYFGGGAVFFAKGRSYLEVINDINSNLTTFYRVCQDECSFAELQRNVHATLHSEAEYRKAKEIWHRPDREGLSDVDVAWATWLQTNMSFSGSPSGGWKWDNGTAGSHSGIVMDNYRNDFTRRIHDRLRHVQISCRDALTVIRQRDRDDTFFYLDPPYPGCDQKHYRGFTFDDFEELLKVLEGIKGRFILSNFPSPILSEYVRRNGWRMKECAMPMKVANFKGRSRTKKEVLVMNYNAEPTLFDTMNDTDVIRT